MRIKQEYRSLSKDELLDKTYELAFNFEKYSKGCSQSTVAAIHAILDMDDIVVKVASSSAGGQLAQVAGTCGGLIGGTIALDYFFGRPADKMAHYENVPGNVELHANAMQIAMPLFYKYIEEYGTTLCPQIQTKLFGRLFYVLDEEEMKKFEEAGGHEDKCTRVVASAARWTMKILLEKGNLEGIVH